MYDSLPGRQVKPPEKTGTQSPFFLLTSTFLRDNLIYLIGMEETFDIAIIGAGPAGLCAARHILNQSNRPTVALIEKTTGRDKRIPCAEGLGKMGFNEVLTPKPSWIRSGVSYAIFHSPDNTRITYTDLDKGYIINRALMQQDLIEESMEQGATVFFNHQVNKVSIPDSLGKRKLLLSNGKILSARVVIDASGPLSRFGSGETIDWKPLDLEIAYFAHINGVSPITNTIHIYIGEAVAPGGYAWVFPRDEKSCNAGIVLGSSFSGKVKIKSLLDTFIKKHFPQGKVVQQCAGTIPCYNSRITIATGSLIKAGDAISTVNPISRAGITEAMKSGTMAGRFALQMLGAETQKQMARVCKNYELEWHRKMGAHHIKLAKVKKFLYRVSDREYDMGAKVLAAIPSNQMTMTKIFTQCLGKYPRLVLALRYLL
jgi:geranylgeranyl reductase family protein